MLTGILLILAILTVVLFSVRGLAIVRRQHHIPGAFVIPAFPLVGNALQVLQNPSKQFLQWARLYNCSIFVIHLGGTPVVVVNSYQDVAALWQNVSMGSRPLGYTYHKVVSALQGLTVGTTPAGATFRRKKKAISLNLSQRQISSSPYCECLDQSSKYVLRQLLKKHNTSDPRAHNAQLTVSFLKYAQYFVLRTSLWLTYGCVLDPFHKDQKLADDIVQTENQIIRLRSVLTNYQDYLPFFNLQPLRSYYDADATIWRSRRDNYMETLFHQFEQRLQESDPRTENSILARILAAKSSKQQLSHMEARSVCLSMVSAGLDNVSLVIDHILGQFSYRKKGYEMQNRLFNELLATNGNDLMQAWNNSALDTTCDYALAVIEEALRYFTVLPLSLPRQTTRDIPYKNILIPAGTIVVMNAYEANHDPSVFRYPDQFIPDRWLDESGHFDKNAPSHFSFGAGSRRCSGDNLALKELYTLLCRTVLLFQIKEPRIESQKMILDPFEGNACPTATSFEPKQFFVRLQARQGPNMYELRKYLLS